MNRRDLQKLTRVRLSEAKALLDKKLYSGAYYLCGYSLECGLKACIAKQTRRHDFPDKKLATDSFTHDLNSLVRVAGLESALNAELARDAIFPISWAIVKAWTPQSRYSLQNATKARNLFKAVDDKTHGVLKWLEPHC